MCRISVLQAARRAICPPHGFAFWRAVRCGNLGPLYRKDIFEKHKLTPPATYTEFLDLACKIPQIEPGMGGVAIRAASGHMRRMPSFCISRRSAAESSMTSGTPS